MVSCDLVAKNAAMPQTMITEIDNTCREGKNQHFECFQNVLVSSGAFETASTEMGEVGHTHNGQDQRFSTCATTLSRASILEDKYEFKELSG